MSDGPDDSGALIERLRVIEAQPLADRADAYDAVLVKLRSALEAADERGQGG